MFLSLAVDGPAPGRDRLLSVRARLGAGADVRDRELAPDGTLTAPRRALEQLARERPQAVFVLPERELAAAWAAELGLAGERWFGLDELAAWIDPGGLGSDAEALAGAGRAGAGPAGAGPAGAVRLAELSPTELRLALAHVVGRTLALPEQAVGALARAWELAALALDGVEPAAASRLRAIAHLVDQPSAIGAPTSLDGRLRECGLRSAELEIAVGSAQLGHEHSTGEDPNGTWPRESLPPGGEGVRPLDEADRELLAQALARPEAIPDGAIPNSAVAAAGLVARPSQVEVLRAVANSLGSGELLLLHAPTGTGKTLAYLLPAMLFAVRNGIRVGIATYTRALQRQAFARDVPLALELLERAGIAERPRAGVLKGRQNYVCGRALALESPREGDEASLAVAYAQVLAFALGAGDGDLDRLPPIERTPFGGIDGVSEERARLVRAVRGRSGCCTRTADRSRCGAESARWRAERSHVVITNQAFALARREFFAHMVFDECEHLHDQAESAFSHVIALAELEYRLRELRGDPSKRGRRSRRRGPVDRLIKAAPAGSKAWELGQQIIDAQEAALSLLGGLEKAGQRFLDWRQAQLASRAERDAHSLLREYVEAAVDPALAALHARLVSSLSRVDACLAGVGETLDEVPGGGGRRLRGALERARIDLLELSTGVDAWLPTHDGEPAFRPETFYDLDPAARGGGLALVARVLLPNEYLGRVALPDLDSAVLLSATTWLGGGFDASKGYLGLDRAAEPAEGEEREPSEVRTFRAPEAFDYGRVLVAIPRDAPDYRAGKAAWLDFAARYVAHLAIRTGGRTLVLMTNASDALDLGGRLSVPLARRGIDVLVQGRRALSNEQLAARFRAGGRAVLIGLDTFWFGADFPGDVLEHVVIPKLPYGVPDRYHHAQCAVLGAGGQRKRIYMPRALGRFRQGFGRLMRRASDKGCVHLLDHRILEPRHRSFLRELPVDATGAEGAARLVRGDSDHCFTQVFEHVGLTADLRAAGLATPFAETRVDAFDDARSEVHEAGAAGLREPRPTDLEEAPDGTPSSYEPGPYEQGLFDAEPGDGGLGHGSSEHGAWWQSTSGHGDSTHRDSTHRDSTHRDSTHRSSDPSSSARHDASQGYERYEGHDGPGPDDSTYDQLGPDDLPAADETPF
ncbi:ATP-dependent DNA helicase [Engelhardtia mirabilis]|uniref:DNA 5'-3' helicase n=1 Tax=Engelhardtia mirabilis TaxID=2528011 RepID=A0A518BFJ5_9BACT|nr:hypothetical protein Pla133_08230 [Planctomycetes bacterium Pla133]QDV00083.1 hypothetical protein Pla86_08220 [Planctomycetes bacterium Pla86]